MDPVVSAAIQEYYNLDEAIDQLKSKVPIDRSPASKRVRMELYCKFDPPQNFYLSVVDMRAGLKDVLGLEALSKQPNLIRSAFNVAANGVNKARFTNSSGRVEFVEFRRFFVYLIKYHELFGLAKTLDDDFDYHMSPGEFKGLVPKLQEWKIPVSNPTETFNEIDVNHTGNLLFNDIADWAIKTALAGENSRHHDLTKGVFLGA